VADLLKAGGIRCLFTTRSDAKIGSVLFQEPKVHSLDPLAKSAAADLLSDISKSAVDNPERSFERLKERLVDDLAGDGWVLPIQMQVVFSGLADLRFLAVNEYERQGGLAGLEALYLEKRISAAGRAVGASVADVRAVLLAMVDRATRKTVPQPTGSLLKVFPGGDSSKLEALLEKLETDEVVRRRIDTGGEGSVWLLDHDYLSRGLLELDRRARRWPLLLEESARAYEGARGFGRWKKLLPPFLQFRLLYERLRGRLTYRSAAVFAWLSTLRLLIGILIPLLAILGLQIFNAKREAGRLLAELGQFGRLTVGECRALWELAGEDKCVRRAFLDAAFAKGRNLGFRDVEEGIFVAIGFRVKEREYVVEKMVRDRCIPENPRSPECFLIRQGVLPREDMKKAIGRLVQSTHTLVELSNLGDLIGSPVGQSDPQLTELLSHKVLEILSSDTRALSITSFGRSIVELIVHDDRRRLKEILLRKFRSNELGPDLFLGSLADSMSRGERNEVLIRVASSLREESGKPLSEVLNVYNLIGESLPAPENRKLLELLLSNSRGADLVSLLNSSPGLLAVLDSTEARTIEEGALLVGSVDREFFWSPDLSHITQQLNSSDALGIWKFWLGEHPWPLPSQRSPAFFNQFRLLAGRLSTEDARLAAAWTLSEMRKTDKIATLSSLVCALAALKKAGRALDSATIDEPVRRTLEELRKPTGNEIDIFADMLSDFAGSMSEGYVREAAALAIAQLESTAAKPEPWVRVLMSLKLTSEEEQRVFGWLRSRMERYPSQIGGYVPFFPLLSEKATPELAGLAFQSWIDHNRISTQPKCEEVASVIRDPKDPRVMDLLKWPTCSEESRDKLIGRLDDLEPNESFGAKGADGKYHADIWGKFIPWAKKQGLDIESPPKPPDLNKLKVDEN
jgi:hypothetical protein